MPDLFCKGDAYFSPCRKWRYTLTRRWNTRLPCMIIIMLNPSTADALKDDPTTRKCMKYARDLGMGSYLAMNLFAFRSVTPAVMKKATDPVGANNDAVLRFMLGTAGPDDILVAAWGNHGYFLGRDMDVMRLITELGLQFKCFGSNKNGAPKHPTYIQHGLPLVPWKAK